MDILLIAGLWLDGASVWDEVVGHLAAPVPEGVTRGIIRLADERRYDVPVVLVCPEFSPAQAREWIDQGELPELGRVLAQVAEGS